MMFADCLDAGLNPQFLNVTNINYEPGGAGPSLKPLGVNDALGGGTSCTLMSDVKASGLLPVQTESELICEEDEVDTKQDGSREKQKTFQFNNNKD